MLLNNKLIFINYLNFKYCKFYWLLFLVFYMYIFWPFFGRPKFKTWPFGHGQTANGQWPTLMKPRLPFCLLREQGTFLEKLVAKDLLTVQQQIFCSSVRN